MVISRLLFEGLGLLRSCVRAALLAPRNDVKEKVYKNENGSLLLRFELPFSTLLPTVAFNGHQVLCKLTDLIMSTL